jgi:hypothetical protein
MEHDKAIIQSYSPVNYDYATIKLTKSRIEKGLIAVPMALANWFPDHSTDIHVYLDDSSVPQRKRYSSCSSSTKECRIGGVRHWFEENSLERGDEIVVQVVDRGRCVYKLIPEKRFITGTRTLQADLDNAPDESDALGKLVSLSQWTNTQTDAVVLNEYRRLLAIPGPTHRRGSRRMMSRAKERTPSSLRAILGHLYEGHCQICDFWFLKRSKEPYFEIHHIDPVAGHHPKNLVLVCGNCHNQFEHADVFPEFDHQLWLVRVRFNWA